MALWDKVRQELDRAGKMAQGALDEGKVRLEAFRARQRADQAAQALGYAVYRARQQGQELDSDTYARLSSTLAAHEAEASGFEARLAELADAWRAGGSRADAPTPAASDATPPRDAGPQAGAAQGATAAESPESGSAAEPPPA